MTITSKPGSAACTSAITPAIESSSFSAGMTAIRRSLATRESTRKGRGAGSDGTSRDKERTSEVRTATARGSPKEGLIATAERLSRAGQRDGLALSPHNDHAVRCVHGREAAVSLQLLHSGRE